MFCVHQTCKSLNDACCKHAFRCKPSWGDVRDTGVPGGLDAWLQTISWHTCTYGTSWTFTVVKAKASLKHSESDKSVT